MARRSASASTRTGSRTYSTTSARRRRRSHECHRGGDDEVEREVYPCEEGTKNSRAVPRGGAVPGKGAHPRVARLMALAIKFDGMIRDGVVKDYAELGRLGKITRARISQIMALTTLAPDI